VISNRKSEIFSVSVAVFMYAKMLLVATAALADFCLIIYSMLGCLILFALPNYPVLVFAHGMYYALDAYIVIRNLY